MSANLFENDKLSVLMLVVLRYNFNSYHFLGLFNNTFINLAERPLTNELDMFISVSFVIERLMNVKQSHVISKALFVHYFLI